MSRNSNPFMNFLNSVLYCLRLKKRHSSEEKESLPEKSKPSLNPSENSKLSPPPPIISKDEVNDGNWKEPDWSFLWDSCKTDVDSYTKNSLNWIRHTILKNKEKYVAVQDKIGVPWFFVAALHYRESSLDFNGVLHNGDKIIGNGKKTTHVPKGRGPFETWEEAAIDAMKMKRYHSFSDWSIPICLKRSERYNGLGYRHKGKGEYTPYVWAGTNHHDETGKYVSDGKFKDSAKEKQMGIAAIYKILEIA